MDEKGCRLTLHHQQTVIAKKGNNRVHLENCTIVACANALGNSIHPMILFKGQRLKPTFGDGLPPGSRVAMSPKGSMTTSPFIEWLSHFSSFIQPPILLIFDGAASHLDLTIVDTAERLGIHLLCLPSNTTHELQPLDKSVCRAFEHHWDDELLRYWDKYPDKKMNKERFSVVFTPVWAKTMTIDNITHGFRATGIYPFDKNVIPEHAYAPSFPTRREQEGDEPESPRDNWDPDDFVPLSLLAKRLNNQATPVKENTFSQFLVTPDMKPAGKKNCEEKNPEL
ncbi:dde superfamily endonuclease [Holotrichia oblita]|uniref:Dde superfamily endonuclease n=1 Tax=Holotrichia oblita TaxID=644536 RepID=A0ACB9T988_HOLOL|nr:dde superfamily endonuclease [Holotrichia oblita]